MKRLSYISLILIFTLILSSCGTQLDSIEDYEWKMKSVMGNSIDAVQSENDFVIAVGESDEAYPNAKIVDLSLTAKDGILTVTDMTNDKTYSGTYKVTKRTPGSIDYEITIDGISGYATVAPTKYHDGSEVPAMPINLGEYSLCFMPKS